MAERVYVGTRKGLFELAHGAGGWEIADAQFLGDPISAVLALPDGALYAALDLGHFGAKLWRRGPEGKWQEIAVPVFPPKPPGSDDDPHPWSLGKIWVIEPGGVPDRLWAGTMPGGLFRSDDGGGSWSLNETLWHMPERRQWMGVAGGEQPGINSVLIDPRDPDDIRVGVSTAGMWASSDGGASWHIINRGMYNEYMPPEQREEPIAQDIHRLSRCAAHPDVVWCQHHNAVFRSEDGGAGWRELTAITPAKFGFAVAAHPRDPDTAWFVPAVKDERRIPVDARLVVARTRDAGRSFEVLRRGLPQR
ncbi:MAG TPA: sialidase family protein, partial [Stellaceae bacterium]|nr:sialidase family protein [Stellaceae bacterium]